MAPEYFETGYPLTQEDQEEKIPLIVITQKDIREIQMAKAAIRAGLETLITEYKTTAEEIGAMYVAGGFGYRLDLNKASAIGLIPPQLASKAKAVGNSSLSGVVKYMLEAGSIPSHIAKQAREVQLADSETFRQLYIDYKMCIRDRGHSEKAGERQRGSQNQTENSFFHIFLQWRVYRAINSTEKGTRYLCSHAMRRDG